MNTITYFTSFKGSKKNLKPRNLFTTFLLLASLMIHAQDDCTDPGENPGDSGCVTFNYQGNPTTYTTIRANDGSIWIQQNLGSENVADTQTNATAYGDLFQWGRWDDGHQLRNSAVTSAVASPNNPLGLNGGNDSFLTSAPQWWDNSLTTDTWDASNPDDVTANKGCDPCKALGNDWSLPSQEDWQSAIDSENITNIASAFASNLKLAVAGSRTATGGFSFTGVRGYYWTKNTSDNPAYSKYLYYSNFIVNAAAGSPRSQGMSVRCIKKPVPGGYCQVSVDYDVEPISLVSFSDIHNITPTAVNASAAYEDFTGIVANVQRGEEYPIIVQGNTFGQFEHDIRVFFDWNQDEIFDMNTEYYPFVLLPSTGNDGVQAAGNIFIPETALIGNTRMRIIKDMWNVYEEGEFDACLNAYYGQVEDYTLNIQENLGTGDLSKNTVKVYPNPTNGIFEINTQGPIKTYTLYNQIGQLIDAGNKKTLNISGLANGIYMLRIEFENGDSTTQRIIKK